MNNEKLTILYERLSHEDGRENESLSIENQKAYLEEYALRSGFKNLVHRTDDGWSGTRWDRPGFLQVTEDISRGSVGQILIKDMSRLGRDHLRVGLFLEQLREMNVRLIAVAEGIDTAKGEDDFMPFRNILAEWHARDTSRKIRAIFGARTAAGNHVTGALPYGYLHDPKDRQKWIVDEEAAPVVKRIFRSVIAGKNIAKITEELTAERILTPNAHWKSIGERTSRGAHNADPYKWSSATVINILKKEEYMGWKVLNKTGTENYKSKQRKPTPENRLVFKDAHPQIIDEETWNIVQRLRGTKRRVYKPDGEPNPLTGVLYCADCGAKMYHKRGASGRPDHPHHEYVCSGYRHYSKSCTCHYIRVEVVEQLILDAIRRASRYAIENEAAFIQRVREEAALQQEAAVRESRRKLTKGKRRREEISRLIKKLYESYAADKIPENHFSELLAGYDAEQKSLDAELERLQAEIDRYNTDSVRADRFLELVKRHTEFTELTPTLLNEFVEKVVVHEAVKIEGKRTMQVDIYLNFIGKFDLPEQEAAQAATPEKKRKKKLRREMSEEQREILRRRDKERYARKVAAKKAAEEAARAEILKGTAYELRRRKAKCKEAHNRTWKRKNGLPTQGRAVFPFPKGAFLHRFPSHPIHFKSNKRKELLHMAKTKIEKIAGIEEEIRQLENKRRQLVQAQKAQERKDRTKRLCKRMGLFESLLPESISLTDEQFQIFLEKTVLTEQSRRILDGLTARRVADGDADEGSGARERG